MRILILNPNTTAAMTEKLVDVARAVAAPGTELIGVQPSWGVSAVQGYADGFVSAAASLDRVRALRAEGLEWDATVYAGFGDHGREGLAEVLRGPVVPIAEAAAMAACLIGHRYAVVTTTTRSVPQIRDILTVAGLADRCAGIHATGLPVLAAPEELLAAFEVQAARAIEAGANVLCLGSGAMAGWAQTASERVGVPVVDGLTAAVTFAEGLVRVGLGQASSPARTSA
ncbi:aspartate/glutamate racemase family protein [Nocardioides acrostichi]|uniref:Asp/Glu/hydantoin racemase n=1 Tax=Nocardioides acrostichi TaxID=2784339 RepID=A0A930Y7G5_9ACTN|nr:aspartate/glutamate racemase family protein [Nocardioides acrostichi]MBF4161976.1 Asp/Glu/hydantoin racemase [Nocardioides acrostichi]